MKALSIAARVTSTMNWKEESPFIQFQINFIEGIFNCLLHEDKLKPNSKIEKGDIIQIDAIVLKTNELLISYYILIKEGSTNKNFRG
ncbi:hypothetical protein [Carnobacterium maltaromaticum]|uniref:hypothetical protein n=1 Tax=Carnobacterium maltaromaticum TaxID=2751 RepID=UPI00295E94C7|nr:hypothetical protein [Carnobacterium maltaromaticum]